MSYENGMAAINLEMPDEIPRTEYSAHFHWDLVNQVTGSNITSNSSEEEEMKASEEFVKRWDYGMFWNILTHNQIFDGKYTKLGHAVFQENGRDFSEEKSNFLEDPEDVFSLDMFEVYGDRKLHTLTEEFNENYKEMCRHYPDTVNMTGIYTTCMSGVLEILGWDTLLMSAGIDIKKFGEFMNRYAEWIGQYFRALAESNSPVVMVHDDITWTSGAFLPPQFYREFIFPNYKKLFSPLAESGKKVLFTSDGNYTEFVDDIAKCGVHGFVFEPCTDLNYICSQYGKSHVIVGNVDTTILLMKGKEEIEEEVKRCINMGKSCPGYFLAVGNHIPPNTPVENALWYQEFYEKYKKR